MPDFVYKHRIASTFFLLWTMVLVTWVTYQVFRDITAINGFASAAYATLFGLPAAAVALYQWRREK